MVANEPVGPTMRRAGRLRADLQYGRIDEILATGLHAFLTQFLDRVNDLGAASAATSWGSATPAAWRRRTPTFGCSWPRC
jgi:uncharacterized alpha-E superfamily protein